MREEDGRTWENTPKPSPTDPSVGFQFHATRERQPRVQSSCEESTRKFFRGEGVSRRRTDARHMHGHVTEQIFSCFSVYRSPLENLKKYFHLCMCEPSRLQHGLYSSTQIFHLCIDGDMEHMTPLPLKKKSLLPQT